MWNTRRSITRRRHFFRYRRRPRRPRHRYWPRRWRRWNHYKRHPRVHKEVLTEYTPRKQKRITCIGWEIMGCNGSSIKQWTSSNQLLLNYFTPNNKEVKYYQTMGMTNTNTNYQLHKVNWGDFQGGYGGAWFTFTTLLQRNRLGMNRFTDSFEGFDWIKYLGCRIQLIRAVEIDYLFRPDLRRAPSSQESADEAQNIHPANLLNFPFVKWVQSLKRSKCCKTISFKIHPPAEMIGWWGVETFMPKTLFGYQWTTIDPNNPLGMNPNTQISLNDGPINNEWLGADNKNIDTFCATWGNRTTWDNQFLDSVVPDGTYQKRDQTIPKNNKKPKHSPFCPPIIFCDFVNTFWFRYKFFFKVGGTNISRYPVRVPFTEINPPCNPQTCEACIKEGDLNKWGLLKEKSLQRITGITFRKKTILEKLTRFIRYKQRKVHWGKKTTRYIS
nr:MAG: ORF1 [Anelloviridae sp.]